MINYVMARLDGSAAHERRVGMAAAKKLSSGTEYCIASLDYDVVPQPPNPMWPAQGHNKLATKMTAPIMPQPHGPD